MALCWCVEGNTFKTIEKTRWEGAIKLSTEIYLNTFKWDIFITGKKENISGDNAIIKVFREAYKCLPSKTVYKLYRWLQDQRRNTTLYIKIKWEKELGVEITKGGWFSMCLTQWKSTNSKRWRVFGWKSHFFYHTPGYQQTTRNPAAML